MDLPGEGKKGNFRHSFLKGDEMDSPGKEKAKNKKQN
jgi:hypothetical protein